MSYNNNLINKMSLTSRNTTATKSSRTPEEDKMLENMADPRYLRQSSSLINEALQKGFDVLQLSDGDLVMTGTKTVVYQYSWDDKLGRLVRTKAMSRKDVPSASRPRISLDDSEMEDSVAEFQV